MHTIGTTKTACYRVAGCLLFRACLSIEVNGRTVGTFRIVVGVPVEGCPLSGVPLNIHTYKFSYFLTLHRTVILFL